LLTALKLDHDDCCGRCLLVLEEFVAVAEREWDLARAAGL
jgi:hypothetical protein